MTGVFASGVASGDVTATSVVLWTRARRPATFDGVDVDGDVDVDWSIRPLSSSGSSTDAVDERAGRVIARRSDDHCVHVDVDGLAPGTTYVYEFRVGDDVVAGRTRTLPTSADSFRFAVACCSRWGWPGFDLLRQIADERPDLLLHLGDSIYEVGESPPDGPPTLPPWECRTLADYRQRHRQHRSHAAWRALFASVPAIVVWDDHEVADNAPDPDDADRRVAGQRAWAEWMPMRRTETVRALDRHVEVPGLLDLLVVDSRFRGRDATTTDGPGDPDDIDGGLLSGEQWDRIDDIAGSATHPWFVFANQVQVGPMTLAARPTFDWPPVRRVVNPDQWDGYPAARRRLYGALQQVHGVPVVLSGDLHSGWARRLTDADGRLVAHEFTSPSISGLTYADAVRDRLPVPSRWLDRWLRFLNRGIDHLDLSRHGYLVCDVELDRFMVTFVSADGTRHVETVGRRP